MSVIDDVKQKVDIVEVIGQSVALSKAGRNFKARCPFHEERTPSFYVFPERQTWHCFGACSTGGDVFSFLMKQQGIDFGEALRRLARQAGITLPSHPGPAGRKDERERLYQLNDAAARFFHEQLLNSRPAATARNYLLRRGLSAGTVAAFNLGYAPAQDALRQHLAECGFTEPEMLAAGLLVETENGTRERFRHRLIFPIRDIRGRTTGFGARVLDNSQPKYTNSPQSALFDKSGSLYGIDLAAPAIRKQDRAVLVEGYMDTLTAHQHGFTNVVASMGTSVTERQVTVLKRLTRNLVLALDADAAGEEAMLRCVDYENVLEAEIKVVTMPAGQDPDDVIREDATAWQQLLENAVPVVDFTFEMKTAGLDFARAGDTARVVRELLPVLARMKDVVRRDHYLRRLERITGTGYNILEVALRQVMSTAAGSAAARRPLARPAGQARSGTREEYCLRLLLQHPGLRDRSGDILPEYFQHSQNRAIFDAIRQSADTATLRDRLDPVLWEVVERLLADPTPPDRPEERLADVALRLKQDYLRALKKAEAETRAAAAGADDSSLQERAVRTNEELRETFLQKERSSRSRRT